MHEVGQQRKKKINPPKASDTKKKEDKKERQKISKLYKTDIKVQWKINVQDKRSRAQLKSWNEQKVQTRHS